MASPVADYYGVVSGGVVAGGRNWFPSWRPAAGVISSISLNNASAVDSNSDPLVNPNHPSAAPWRGVSGQSDIWNGWCGHIFAPHCGALGSIIAFGGGHAGYLGNDVYAFDLSTRLWERLSNPFYPFTADGGGWYGDSTYGEYYDATLTPISTQPAAAHTYDIQQYLPPSLGGGPKGSLLLLHTTSMPPLGSRSGAWTHRFDLDTRVWSRFGGNSIRDTGGNSGLGMSCMDTLRTRIWYVGQHLVSAAYKYVHYLDLTLATPLWSLASGTNSYTAPGTGTMDYCPTHDIIVGCNQQSGPTWVIWYINPASPAWPPTALTVTGAALSDLGYPAVVWHPEMASFIIWNGRDGIYKLTPPATNPYTNAWVLSALTFSGSSPSIGETYGGRAYKKVFYAPSLKAMVSEGRNDTPVYCWNTEGL